MSWTERSRILTQFPASSARLVDGRKNRTRAELQAQQFCLNLLAVGPLQPRF